MEPHENSQNVATLFIIVHPECQKHFQYNQRTRIFCYITFLCIWPDSQLQALFSSPLIPFRTRQTSASSRTRRWWRYRHDTSKQHEANTQTRCAEISQKYPKRSVVNLILVGCPSASSSSSSPPSSSASINRPRETCACFDRNQCRANASYPNVCPLITIRLCAPHHHHRVIAHTLCAIRIPTMSVADESRQVRIQRNGTKTKPGQASSPQIVHAHTLID